MAGEDSLGFAQALLAMGTGIHQGRQEAKQENNAEEKRKQDRAIFKQKKQLLDYQLQTEGYKVSSGYYEQKTDEAIAASKLAEKKANKSLDMLWTRDVYKGLGTALKTGNWKKVTQIIHSDPERAARLFPDYASAEPIREDDLDLLPQVERIADMEGYPEVLDDLSPSANYAKKADGYASLDDITNSTLRSSGLGPQQPDNTQVVSDAQVPMAPQANYTQPSTSVRDALDRRGVDFDTFKQKYIKVNTKDGRQELRSVTNLVVAMGYDKFMEDEELAKFKRMQDMRKQQLENQKLEAEVDAKQADTAKTYSDIGDKKVEMGKDNLIAIGGLIGDIQEKITNGTATLSDIRKLEGALEQAKLIKGKASGKSSAKDTGIPSPDNYKVLKNKFTSDTLDPSDMLSLYMGASKYEGEDTTKSFKRTVAQRYAYETGYLKHAVPRNAETPEQQAMLNELAQISPIPEATKREITKISDIVGMGAKAANLSEADAGISDTFWTQTWEAVSDYANKNFAKGSDARVNFNQLKVNLTNMLSGAAVSPEEMKRLDKALGNLGSNGLYTVLAKLKSTMESQARRYYGLASDNLLISHRQFGETAERLNKGIRQIEMSMLALKDENANRTDAWYEEQVPERDTSWVYGLTAEDTTPNTQAPKAPRRPLDDLLRVRGK